VTTAAGDRPRRSELVRSARRFAREVRTPDLRVWHGVADPRSWSTAAGIRRRLHPSVADMRRVVRIARTGRDGGRYLATLPRSGTNWLSTMLDSAYNLELGLDGDFDYVRDYWPTGDPGWAPHGRRLVWPVAALSLTQAVQRYGDRDVPDLPVLGSHFPLTRGIHPLDVGGRPVVLVRHPAPAIRSLVHMRGTDDPEAHERRALRLARDDVRFFAHWARAIDADRAGRILLVRYEDLTGDPAGELARVSDHWELGLSSGAVAGAVDLCSQAAMAAKAGSDPANTRVRVAEPPPVDERLAERLDAILRDELCDPLGYDVDPPGTAPTSVRTSSASRSEEQPST
jgi:hypothetical protein